MKQILRISRNTSTIPKFDMKLGMTFILIFMFLLNIKASNAIESLPDQTIVSGFVTDDTGAALPGVNIVIVGTSTGTQTDFDGNYSISASSGDVLSFSYLGMETVTITVGNSNTINVQLKADKSNILDEVVVVGYGTQKKVNLTGSLSTVKADEIADRPITSASQALSGLAAGVSVSQRSGRPGGDDAVIRIRGVGTLGDANALVLIDGLAGSLNNVNPSDIESITVLKDAASTSIYGSRAANGVILVTTKKGKEGKLSVVFDFYGGMQQATKLTDYVTNSADMMELYNLAIHNEDPTAQPGFTQGQISEFRNGTDPYIYPNTNWNDLMYSSAAIQSYNLRVGGGNENTRYSFSLGYLDQEGVLLGTSAQQYSVRLNLDSQVSKKFSYSVNISGRHDDVDESVVGSGTLTGWVNRAKPYYTPYLEDGRYGGTWIGNASQNSLAGALEGKNHIGEDNVVLNMSAVYEFFPGFKYKGTAGVSKRHELQKIFRPEIYVYNPKTLEGNVQGFGGASLSAYNDYIEDTDLTFISTFTYDKTFAENHNISLLAGFQQETSKFNFFSASKAGIPSNALQEIDAGAVDPTASGYLVEFGLQSYFGRASYNYKEKYLFEANFRYDGSSNFGPGNKWGFFPSVSAGWNISKEDFLKDSEIINSLKLRASWGQLGNQAIAPNQYSATYSLGQGYSYGGALNGGAAQTKLPNEDVTWETSTQTDIGVDLTAWDGKLNLVVDYFDKLTEDILRPINISSVIGGLAPPTVNLASVKNTGFEIAVNHKNKIGDFSYGIGFNITKIDNEVTVIPTTSYSGYTRIAEGSPIDEFYMIKMIGIFQDEADVIAHGAQPTAKPGDVKFEDFDNNGIIDGDDRQAVGSSIPDLTYGITLDAGYKGFDFAMLFQGVSGIEAITEHEQKPFFNGAGIPTFWQENAWTAENPNNSYPRLTRSSNYMTNGWRDSSFLLEDASFFRIKNIQLGYSFSEEVLKKLRMDRLRLYINAQNPYTKTDYRGLDPEKNVTAGRGSYSNVSIYSFGINISL